jgi:flap endonuclease-1
MGIVDLKKEIKTVGKTVSLNQYRGKRIGVDTSCFLYQFIRSDLCRKIYPDSPLLYGFTKQLNIFRKYQITPVYVFDGKPPQEKIVIGDRQKVATKSKNDIQNLDDCIAKVRQFQTIADVIESIVIEDTHLSDFVTSTEEETIEELIFALQLQKEKKELQSIKPTKNLIDQCKELFEHFGVPMIQSDGEADGMLAQLSHDKLIDAVLTTDTDQFAFGSATILLVPDTKDISEPIQYLINDVYNCVGMTHDQFVDFCILCGCDYVKRIKGLGSKTAMTMIKKFNSIENILTSIEGTDKYEIPDNYQTDIETARTMFTCNPDGTLPFDLTPEKLVWTFNRDTIKPWFEGEHPILAKKFKNTLFPQGVQGTMTQYLIQPDDSPVKSLTKK